MELFGYRKKIPHKAVSLVLAAALIATTFATGAGGLVAEAATADTADVGYVGYDVSSGVPVPFSAMASNATAVTSGDTTWGQTEQTTWYYVPQNTAVPINTSVNISGNVSLILEDGCSLTVIGSGTDPGIHLMGSNSLTIYAQTGQTGGIGSLTASGRYSAGIGGGTNETGGIVNIYGGTVIAKGGNYGAGIGGGGSKGKGGSGGTVTIYGGTVTANGTGGAGIGGGSGGSGGTVTIYGGTVTASGNSGNGKNAGIGGGYNGAGGTNIFAGGTNIFAGGSIYASSVQGQPKSAATGGVSVYETTVAGLPDPSPVTYRVSSASGGNFSGTASISTSTGANSSAADCLYLWLPAGTALASLLLAAGTPAAHYLGAQDDPYQTVTSYTGTNYSTSSSDRNYWTAVSAYTATFDPNNGTSDTPSEYAAAVSGGKASVAAPAAPTRAGYAFAGWGAEKYQAGDYIELTDDAAFSAQWTVAQKPAPGAPAAPTLSSKTSNSVTLTANAAYEFSKDGTAWQTSNEFDGLTANTAYTFYQRVAATDDTEASAASPKLDVTTDASTTNVQISITQNPVLSFLHAISFGLFFDKTIDVSIASTGLAADHYQYQEIAGGGAFDADGVWTQGSSFSISPDFKGYVYARAVYSDGSTSDYTYEALVVDTAKPEITADYNTSSASIAVSVKDSGAGINTITYQVGSNTAQTITLTPSPTQDITTQRIFTISNLPDGQYDVVIDATDNSGNTADAKTIHIGQGPAVVGATISPAAKKYDFASHGDVATNITWNSASKVTSVKYEGTGLKDSNYQVSGDTLTIKGDYLQTLNLSSGDSAEFAISFDAGSPVVFTVDFANGHTPERRCRSERPDGKRNHSNEL